MPEIDKVSLSPNAGTPGRVQADAAAARAMSTIQTQFVIARTNPRNDEECMKAIEKSFKKLEVAANATYSYPRGDTPIVGKAIGLAVECARLWKNVSFGYAIVDETADTVHIRGSCIDLETNVERYSDARFGKRHARKGKDGAPTTYTSIADDERAMRELRAKEGAIVERNAILRCLPEWVTERAFQLALATVAQQQDDRPIEDIRADAVRGLESLGVTLAMIARKLGHSIDKATKADLVELRRLYTGVKDGLLDADEAFAGPVIDTTATSSPPPAAAPATGPVPPKNAEDVKANARKKKNAPPAAAPAAAPPAAEPDIDIAPDAKEPENEESEPVEAPEVVEKRERGEVLAKLAALMRGATESEPRSKVTRAIMNGAGVARVSELPLGDVPASDATEYTLRGLLRDLEELAKRAPRA